MTDCVDNIPDRSTIGLIELLASEADLTGWLADSSDASWIKRNIAFAEFYGITLCDEPEAHLLAGFVENVCYGQELQATLPPQNPEQLKPYHHIMFLRSYLNLHNLPTKDAELQFYQNRIQKEIDEKVRSNPDNSLIIDKWLSELIVQHIKSLTKEHSRQTEIPIKPVEIVIESGTVILGSQNPFQCIPKKVDEFKETTKSKSAPVNSTKDYYVYQIKKCGDREYLLETLGVYLVDRIPKAILDLIDFELEDNIKKYADGITSNPPGAPKQNFGCCILDAKCVMNTTFTMYQSAKKFRQAVRIKHRRKLAKARRWAIRKDMGLWYTKRTAAVKQLTGYVAACLDPNIPVTRILYIVSHKMAEEYFMDMLPKNTIVNVVKSFARSSESWKS